MMISILVGLVVPNAKLVMSCQVLSFMTQNVDLGMRK